MAARKPKGNSAFRVKKPPPFPWLGEMLNDTPDGRNRPMFGCRAYYLGNLNVAVLTEQEEPWNGYLLPTSREHHEALQKQWPMLEPHPILGKWLYLSQSHPDFESISEELARAALKRDPRIGIESKGKKRRRTT